MEEGGCGGRVGRGLDGRRILVGRSTKLIEFEFGFIE